MIPRPREPDGALVYLRTAHDNDALVWLDRAGRSVTESQFDILRAARCCPDTPALPRHETHHALVRQAAQNAASHDKQVGGQLGRPSGARFRTYERLKNHAEKVRGTIFDTDPLRRAIDDIYRHPLCQTATDSLNRQLKSGISDERPRRPRHRPCARRTASASFTATTSPANPVSSVHWVSSDRRKTDHVHRPRPRQESNNTWTTSTCRPSSSMSSAGTTAATTPRSRSVVASTPSRPSPKSGVFVVYLYIAQPGAGFPGNSTRRKIERSLAKQVREHLIIFCPHDRSVQYWLWVKREPGRAERSRSHIRTIPARAASRSSKNWN